VVHIDKSGLVTVCGGKWTTYRKMAEDCVNQAAMVAHLEERACVTEHLPIRRSEDPGLEMARTVEDVLARRERTLFLNARAAIEMAPAVADTMARELGFGKVWKARQLAEFQAVAANYILH
jgi:glycerol-3-phosphate dehydrogenase